MLPYSKQKINPDDIRGVVKVLKSNFLTKGKKIIEFENKISKYVNSKYAIAISSASAGLHLSCLVLGLKKNDTLWTVPNTFVASATCGLHCGAKIDFVDIDPLTRNICVKSLKKKLRKTKKKKLPKILVPVHFAGQITDQEEIYKLSKKYKFKILEDCSHSLGSTRRGQKAGNCKFSDLCVFSFHPVKPITTAEGGIITTNNKNYYEKLKLLRDHGIKRNFKYSNFKNQNWYYEQILPGFNYRMNEIQASLGITQLKKLDKYNFYRNKAAKYYHKKLKNFDVTLPFVKDDNYSSYHLYVISFKENFIKNNYNDVYKRFINEKINVNLHYLPLHLQPYFKKMGFKKGDFPNAEIYAKTSFSIPLFYGITKNEQTKVINCIEKILQK